jgi:uncharacterized protein (DUF1778 family)
MPTKTIHAAKRETLNVRIKAEDRNLIDRAAHVLGKSRTDFLLEAGRRAAEDALLDRTLFKVSPKAYADVHGGAEPTAGLIGKPVFVVINAYGAQRCFREIENLMAL